jgi:1,2-phenylacetyl-CoA epoxidase PaaB subunit
MRIETRSPTHLGYPHIVVTKRARTCHITVDQSDNDALPLAAPDVFARRTCGVALWALACHA